MQGEKKRPPISPEQMELIVKQAEGIRYGTLNLVFQDGVLIQIDRSEKLRLHAQDKK